MNEHGTINPKHGIPAPDERPLGPLQAGRLARIANVDVKTVANMTVREIGERARFAIDPALLGFRRICGKVVKTDPVTGIQYPVPYATVEVEDTDSHFWSYAPHGSPWCWLWPYRTTREVIATVRTDRCGHFCVWVPRFEIDWILRWRRSFQCYDIFVKPTLRDVLGDLLAHQPVIRKPFPEPGPDPLRLDPGQLLRYPHPDLSPAVTRQLAGVVGQPTFGASLAATDKLLDRPAFATPPKPALPKELARLIAKGDHATIARDHGFAVDTHRLHADNFVGPFFRCHEVWMPVWQPIVDVPDITFRVTQDVDGDGDQETIYSEGYFDVRWDAGAIPDVTLEASSIAVAAPTCDHPNVQCADVPAIRFVGLMPLEGPSAGVPFHDASEGYARRPNRTRPIPPAAQAGAAPYCGEMQLFGCVEVANATYYRIMRRFGTDVVPMTEQWYIHRTDGTSLLHTPDSAGWYPVRHAADGWDELSRLIIMNWRTGAYADGRHELVVQTANAAHVQNAAASAPVAFQLHNRAPNGSIIELRWRPVGGAWSAPLPRVCPTIVRSAGEAIEFKAIVSATSPQLRSATFTAGGCGAAATPILTGPGFPLPGIPTRASSTSQVDFWYDDLTDTSWSETLTFSLASGAPAGAYHFDFWAHARSYNPSGDTVGLAADFFVDPALVYSHDQMTVAIFG